MLFLPCHRNSDFSVYTHTVYEEMFNLYAFEITFLLEWLNIELLHFQKSILFNMAVSERCITMNLAFISWAPLSKKKYRALSTQGGLQHLNWHAYYFTLNSVLQGPVSWLLYLQVHVKFIEFNKCSYCLNLTTLTLTFKVSQIYLA